MKHYTYKVTFPGFRWFYFGVHTDNGKPYFGSPKTHRWIWDFYDCEVQILEKFETRGEAISVESRLIKPFLNDPNCLNEHYGSAFSTEASRLGAEAQPREVRQANGRKAAAFGIANKVGAHGRSFEEIQKTARENFSKQTLEQKRANAYKQHSQRWQCLVTGYVTTPGPLSMYQKARGIDTSLRVKLA